VLAIEGGPNAREPIVRGRVVMPGSEPIEGRFLLDEPHPHCLLFATPFATAHKLPAAAEALTGRLLEGSATGVGGKTPYRVGRIGALELGAISVARPTAAFADSRAGAFARADIAGIIGGEILRRFRVIFDVPHGQVILEKGRSFAEPIDWTASGLKLKTARGDFHQFEVIEVLETGPGAESGVRAGDRITAIDGKPGSQWTLWDVECLFKQAEGPSSWRSNAPAPVGWSRCGRGGSSSPDARTVTRAAGARSPARATSRRPSARSSRSPTTTSAVAITGRCWTSSCGAWAAWARPLAREAGL